MVLDRAIIHTVCVCVCVCVCDVCRWWKMDMSSLPRDS